jgi:hypothetical protein
VNVLVYVAIFFVGLASSRTMFIAKRGGIEHWNATRTVLGAAAVTVLVSLLFWGFASLPWYLPVCVFLVGNIGAGLLISRANWPAWFSASAVLDVIVVAGGLYLWIWHWPFR